MKKTSAKKTIDLSRQQWTLTGYNPNFHLLEKSWEIPEPVIPFTETIPAQVPGSVQENLKKAGMISDWNIGRNSISSEWVENRDWSFQTLLDLKDLSPDETVTLHCEGLDYKGIIKLNGKKIGNFADGNIPHAFVLSPHLVLGKENRLEIVFQAQDLPRWFGQVYYTSKIREQKTRFYYTWDWCPRIVQVGIWDSISLEITSAPSIQNFQLYTTYCPDSQKGALHFKGMINTSEGALVRLSLFDGKKKIKEELFDVWDWNQLTWKTWQSLDVEAWWPNLCGAQKQYKVMLELLDQDQRVLDQVTRNIGFRSVTWKRCEGAVPESDPWICVVNGKETFLWGINWVPTLPNFADETPERIGLFLKRYIEMGCNLIRINGVGILGKQTFYDQCDALGIFVWQDFTLCSSGLDNHPDDDPELIEVYARQAKSIISRRQQHPSLLLWCGGNELYETGYDANGLVKGYPLTHDHPMMRRLGEIVRSEDPSRRFLASTAGGPLSTATYEELGQGRAWDVHGPWNIVGDEKSTEAYWAKDDALFRSEVGFPGAMHADLIRKYAGDLSVFPVSRNSALYKTCAWWVNSDVFEKEKGRPPESLDEFCEWSQKRQAHWLLYALKTVRGRFPRAGGMMLWMGHDCFPCPTNTSVIDFEGNPKQAALDLGAWIRQISPHDHGDSLPQK